MEYEDPLNHEYQLTTGCEQLNALLAANAETARNRAVTLDDQFEIAKMARPLSYEAAYRCLGLMLGSLPPATIFLLYARNAFHVEPWAVLLLCWVTIVTSAAGYSSGNMAGKAARRIGRLSRSARALVLPIIGFMWGYVCGAAGGVFVFVIGAFVGAIIGGVVGAVAMTAFYPLHKLVSTAGTIEQKHLLPIATGVTLTICALIVQL